MSAITSMTGLQNLPNLNYVEVSYHGLQSLDLSGLSNLVNIYLSSNDEYGPGLSDLNISGCPLLQYANLVNNNLPQTKVDEILVTLDSNGLTNGYVYTNGGTNAAPSGAGLTAVTSLQGKGWTVFTN